MADSIQTVYITQSVQLVRSEIMALIPAAAQQIATDFNRAGILLVPTAIDLETPENLRAAIAQSLETSGGITNESFFQLLYLSDIPESRVQEIDTSNHTEFQLRIAEIIIIRALQKVWFRKKYAESQS
ncbi:MAG: hypothetical protein ACRCYO_12675 [Bacteroidia bacterium]